MDLTVESEMEVSRKRSNLEDSLNLRWQRRIYVWLLQYFWKGSKTWHDF